MAAKKSNFLRILEDICREEGISLDSFSYGWGHRLRKDGRTRYILGYQFPLNTASVKEFCQDKVLTYQILDDSGIPAVEHVFLPHNIASTGLGEDDVDHICRNMLALYGTVVVKDNNGTGGNKVFKAETMEEIQQALAVIYAGNYGASISPYYDILEEYRVILLDGEPLLVIRKDRAYVLDEEGKKQYLNWRHNLGQGARGVILEENEVPDGVRELAVSAAAVFGARFVSVDVVAVPSSGPSDHLRPAGEGMILPDKAGQTVPEGKDAGLSAEAGWTVTEGKDAGLSAEAEQTAPEKEGSEGTKLMVLEINGGVMMEHLSGQSPEYYEKAKEVYRKAVLLSFEED
ncbi:MAG: hypothetical protein IIY77_08115 [Lachnospiraceae bacterium]|nr:hypothetical protein [Lachnospiraceae bacterium]